MPGYESEITKFLRGLKDRRPELEQAQLNGRALLWDKEPLDPAAFEEARKALVQQKPYVYQTD